MREQLIGYLLDALDASEQEAVETRLNEDAALRRELELLRGALQPLACDKSHLQPPPGLAQRTCEFVAMQAKAALAPAPVLHAPSRWTWADLVVAAAIFAAASMLFFPAVNQSRFAARLTGCQNNLRNVGVALSNYSWMHDGYFPKVPADGCLAVAGIYAPRLWEQKLVSGPNVFICPASVLADSADAFRLPTCEEMRRAQGEQLARLHQMAGGSYGYNIGYIANKRYHPTKNRRRATFALMADAPATTAPYHSLNHGRAGQNVLFEDMHVQFLTACKAHGCGDNFFVNDEGKPAPGLHRDDAVLGGSALRVLLEPDVQDASAGELE
jgi:hypothetical protein